MQDKLTIIEGMGLTETSQQYLLQTAKWAKFLAIVGFVLYTLLIILSILVSLDSTLISDITSSLVRTIIGSYGVPYLFLALLTFILFLFLFQFSHIIKSAINLEDVEKVEKGFKKLASRYKFIRYRIFDNSCFILYTYCSCIYERHSKSNINQETHYTFLNS